KAGDPSNAAGRLQHRTQDAHGRGLAGAIGPEQTEDLAGAAFEVEVVHGQDLAATQVAERLGQVLDVDHGRFPGLVLVIEPDVPGPCPACQTVLPSGNSSGTFLTGAAGWSGGGVSSSMKNSSIFSTCFSFSGWAASQVRQR